MPELVTNKLSSWLDAFVSHLPNIAAAIVAMAVFWYAAKYTGRGAHALFCRRSDHEALCNLGSKIVRFLVTACGLVIALKLLSLDDAAATFLAGAGIIGLAVGFAFQDLTANFISGVAMALRRPLRPGDLVRTNDVFGVVEQIDLRSTSIRTLQGNLTLIPNRKIYENILTNFTEVSTRRVDLKVGVSYSEDLEEVRRVAMSTISALDFGTDRDVEFLYTGFGNSSIDCEVRYWVDASSGNYDYLGALSEGVIALKSAFDEHGITIPFPIRTLDFGAPSVEAFAEHLPPALRSISRNDVNAA